MLLLHSLTGKPRPEENPEITDNKTIHIIILINIIIIIVINIIGRGYLEDKD